jgi:hypothetical protein
MISLYHKGSFLRRSRPETEQNEIVKRPEGGPAEGRSKGEAVGPGRSVSVSATKVRELRAEGLTLRDIAKALPSLQDDGDHYLGLGIAALFASFQSPRLAAVPPALILESPELLEVAEHALARELLIMEFQRWAMYDDMTPEFLQELNISEQERGDIIKHSAWLIPKLRAAKERREKASDWQPMSNEEEKEYLAKLFHRTSPDNAQTRTKRGRRD